MSSAAFYTNRSRKGVTNEGRRAKEYGYLCFVVLARKRVFDVRKLNKSRSHLQKYFIVMGKNTSSQMLSFYLAVAK